LPLMLTEKTPDKHCASIPLDKSLWQSVIGNG
jgi:hypothetical protein